MTAPQPRPGILDIAPYVGGESKAATSRVIRLAANEGALGASPRAIAAYEAQAGSLYRYPDGGAANLRRALGHRHGLDPSRIVCGNGSGELISLLVKCYAGAGDEVLYSAHGFLLYKLEAQAAGATPVEAPETGLRTNVDALLARVTSRTRLVFVANPNNPTGSYNTADELTRLRDGLPADVLLVIDAAYAEYVTRNDYADGSALVDRAPNTVMTRTFSKIYGLAALRLGWAYCPEPVADVLNRVRGPFNVTAPAQAAAIAALEDVAFIDASRAHNETWRGWTAERLLELGLTVHPSVGNFLLVDFAGQAADAEAVRLCLKDRGVLVRQMGAYGLPTCLRVSIGTEPEMRDAVKAIAACLDPAP